MATGQQHYMEAERLLAQAMTPPELPGAAEEWAQDRIPTLLAAIGHGLLAVVAPVAYMAVTK